MKRSALLLSLVGISGYASAQSAVTVYGIADLNVSQVETSTAKKTSVGSGGNATSRIGFKGEKPLQNGVKASFVFEAQVFADSGDGQFTNTNNQTTGTSASTSSPLATGTGLSFARRSTVSLSNEKGEIRAGRDFSSHYRNRVEVDPFGNAGIGAIQPFLDSKGGSTSTRVSNMVGYYLPTFNNGVYGQIQYFVGENASNSTNPDDGTGVSGRLGWQSGAWNISFASASIKYKSVAAVAASGSTAAVAAAGDVSSVNLGIRYKLSDLQLMAGVYRDEVNQLPKVLKADGWMVGGIYKIGQGDVKVAFSEYGTDATGSPRAKKTSLGYVYNMDKDVAVYGTYASVQNSGGGTSSVVQSMKTGANQSSSGIEVGVRYNF